MIKKFFAPIFIFALSIFLNTNQILAATTGTQDPYHLYNWVFDEDEDGVDTTGVNDRGFNYQLRSVSGNARDSVIAGNQWFATVYENYFWSYFNGGSGGSGNNNNGRSVYRRTLGGEMASITFETAADLLNDYNYVLVTEPNKAYNEWVSASVSSLYDTYADPFESLCLVITEGRGDFNMTFANAYARHFPFWWGRSSGTYGNYTYDIHSPISYTIPLTGTNRNKIYSGYGTSGGVAYTISDDTQILDISGNLVYTISGDTTSAEIYNSSNTLVYKLSDDIIYDKSDTETYTLEYSDTRNYLYICPVRSVGERITFSDFDGAYSIRTTLSENKDNVMPGDDLTARVYISGNSNTYGSALGYMNFSQNADFMTGYNNYGESSLLPVVIANVSDGNASTNPLGFDMIIYNNSLNTNNRNNNNRNTVVTNTVTEGNIINRVKFDWAADASETKDLGTFFILRSTADATTAMPEYKIETRITNNTGTRYKLQRYDMINQGDITPDHWEFNIVRDMRGTLPDKFYLDSHSQIAPGLITVYTNTANTLSTENDTSESFALYEYSSQTPSNLTLKYKIIGGMTAAGEMQYLYTSNDVGVRGFNMEFVNLTQNESNTDYQLRNIMGKSGSMIDAADSAVTPTTSYLGSNRYNAFGISKAVPAGLVELSSANIAVSGDASSEDKTPTPTTVALQPVLMRLKLARSNSLISSNWDRIASSSGTLELINNFRNYATIWVRSAVMPELDVDLLGAVSRQGVDLSKCVKAFVYDDEVVFEFITILADSGITDSQGYTNAFIKTFTDDDVPYILIGDGKYDEKWDLEFFIGSTSLTPETSDITNSGDNSSSTKTNTNPTTNDVSGGSGGGGGCNLGLSAVTFLAALIFGLKHKRK